MSPLREYFDKIANKRLKTRKRNRYYWNDITRYCDYFIHDDYSVIEIGCGNGEMIAQLKGNKKAGIDFSPAMIQNAKNNHPNVDFYLMDANDITLNEKFDVIIISNVIGYLDDIQEVFEQLKKLCHRNTKVIVTYYSYLWEPWLKLAESMGLKMKTPNQNWLSDADIKNLLYLAGFDTYRMAHRQIIPINIPIISWFFNKTIARLPLFNQLCISKYAFARPEPTALKDFTTDYSVSVVIPARNESGNIENAIKRLPKLGKHTEIIFIEGNSTDDTWEAIQAVQKKYATTHDIKIGQQEGKGKNDAVKKGFAMATCDILMILDADLTVPPEDLPKFYEAISSGKGDFING